MWNAGNLWLVIAIRLCSFFYSWNVGLRVEQEWGSKSLGIMLSGTNLVWYLAPDLRVGWTWLLLAEQKYMCIYVILWPQTFSLKGSCFHWEKVFKCLNLDPWFRESYKYYGFFYSRRQALSKPRVKGRPSFSDISAGKSPNVISSSGPITLQPSTPPSWVMG